ncbi:benzoate-CoA ligase family protein [Pseudorhodoplanes sp.]|uniref:benzoate-CoA ligase family protein n=1 Tax=Pseudorhodoplanes sp. TaxID=1934341 RepID=UPI002CEACDD1|nr:benzoate-CoA ligase family protein [Pseudorhodoplanes sp.]HWV43658.1 benzoate-CoA ligase family protein [Pseudorhodoplanes sp.]
MIRSGHIDTFARDNLPPQDQWPEFLFTLPELQYPDRLNCVTEFVDKWVTSGQGDRVAIVSPKETLTYAQLAERINRIANVLTRDLGMVSGNRVLLRSANNPMMIAAYLAVMKAGGVTVATMPLLRAKELSYTVKKAKIKLALCDARLSDEMEKTRALAPELETIVYWGEGQLEALMNKPGYETFTACDTAVDDVCLIAFTSGTTGEPKGTMHFHRDMLAPCDSYGKHVLQAAPDDRFIGSAPLAFTFGLGGHVLFPFRIGATSIQLEKLTPEELLPAIETYKATIVFTAPTAYRAVTPHVGKHDISSLRKCVSAGETLPKTTFEAWKKATGITILDGIGGTEMMHIFIGSPESEVRGGSTGKPVPGYIAKVVDDSFNEVPRGTIGRLAVKGPTGCRYLADARQTKYVQNGWNFPGDTYVQDADGYFWYQARSDDMIISSGYNIAGPEVEEVLLAHPAVAECGVVGAPDPERGHIVKAYIVLRAGHTGDAALTKALQDHVKNTVAPYKYPRAIEYVSALPRTQTGKLQRFELRKIAESAGEKIAS